nr:replicase P1 [Blueberry shock virus]
MDPVKVSELLVSVLQKQCSDENTAIGKAFAEHGVQLVERTLPKSRGEKLNVSFQLSAEQQALLRKNFPGREINFLQCDASSHSFAAAHRLLETDFIYKCFGTTTEKILDLGGNFVSHLKRGRYNVHSCCPLLDDRDGARFTERFISLKTFYSAHSEERHEASFCNKTFQQCEEHADYAMAIHAISDLPITELCQSLATKGVKKMILSVMMDPNMLIRDVGEIPNFNVRWEIDRDKDKITFDFIDAACLGYTHKFSVLQQYLTTNAVIVGKSKAFRIERKSDMGGVFIIDITEVAGYHEDMSVGVSRSCAWTTLVRNKTVVLTSNVHDDWWYDVERKSKVLMDTKVLTRVLEAAFRQFKPNAEPEAAIQSIATMLSSSTNYTIINGVTLQAGESLSIDDYVAVATTVYVRTKEVYESLAKNIEALAGPKMINTNTQECVDANQGLVRRHHVNPVNFVHREIYDFFWGHKDVKRTTRGKEETLEVGRNFRKTVRGYLYECVGKQGANNFLISNPNFFVPLQNVLEAEWDGTPSLSVAEAYKHVVGTELDRLDREREERSNRMQTDAKLQNAILSIAKWVEANPTAEGPKGLGEVVALIPDHVKAFAETPDIKAGVINKYASEINEAITYYEAEVSSAERKLREVGNHCNWSNSFIATIWSGDDSRRVYLPRQNKWLGPPSIVRPEPTAAYERGLVKDGYVRMAWDEGTLHVDEVFRKSLLQHSAIFFDKSCEFAAGLRLLPALREALTKEAKFTRKLVDGVAGCGKTTRIISDGKLMGDSPDLFLTSNKSSAMELREKLEGSALIKASRVRTCDSYLMHGSKVKTKKLLFDECFLTHAGCVYAAATLSEAEEIVMYGDTEQIPFISRIPHLKLRCHKVTADDKVQVNKTYRCPADATYCLSRWMYKRNLKTANRTIRSLGLRPIVSSAQIDKNYDLFLTHTQAEKHTLIASGFPKEKVFTSAEAQGKTVNNVAFVRLTRTSISLYTGKDPLMGPCHCLVALSRHTKKFDYFTVADSDSDDLIAKAIRDSRSASDERIYSFVHNDFKL